MGSIPSSDSRRPLPGGPSVTQAEPSWSVGSGVPRFLVPVTTSPGRAPCAMDSHVHSGSAPRVSHPLGGFLAYPGFAAFGPTSPWCPTTPLSVGACAPPSSELPLPFRTFPFKVPPAGIACPFRDRWLPRRSGWRRVRVRTRRALISLDFLRRPRPSGPPSPRRQDCSRATSCAADLGAVAGLPPGLERRFTRAETPVSSSLAGTANRAHPRDAPSTSERSSSRVPDALPWLCSRFVGRDLRGVLSLQSVAPASGLWP